MADPAVLVGAQLWLGGYDLGTDINSLSLTASRAELGDARLADDISATYPGIQSVDCQTDGFWAAGAGNNDAVTAARIITKDAAEWPLTICPPSAPGAGGAGGNVAYNLRTAQFATYFGAQHGESLPFRLTSRARTGRLDRGTIIAPKTTYVATTNGTAYQVGAASATQQVVAILHVFSVNGGTWTVTVESDNGVGMATPVTRFTFTGATAVTRQVMTLAGAVTDDYWRAVVTETVAGTDVSLSVVLAITPA